MTGGQAPHERSGDRPVDPRHVVAVAQRSGFNHEIAAVVAHELASVAESLFSAWAASPQGQVAAMMMQAAHEREQNEGREASDAPA